MTMPSIYFPAISGVPAEWETAADRVSKIASALSDSVGTVNKKVNAEIPAAWSGSAADLFIAKWMDRAARLDHLVDLLPPVVKAFRDYASVLGELQTAANRLVTDAKHAGLHRNGEWLTAPFSIVALTSAAEQHMTAVLEEYQYRATQVRGSLTRAEETLVNSLMLVYPNLKGWQAPSLLEQGWQAETDKVNASENVVGTLVDTANELTRHLPGVGAVYGLVTTGIDVVRAHKSGEGWGVAVTEHAGSIIAYGAETALGIGIAAALVAASPGIVVVVGVGLVTAVAFTALTPAIQNAWDDRQQIGQDVDRDIAGAKAEGSKLWHKVF